MHPTGRAIYVPCGGAEKGPFFIGASNMSISMIGIQQGNPSDQDCSAGKSIGSRLLSRETHRSDQDCPGGPAPQSCRCEPFMVSGLGFRLLGVIQKVALKTRTRLPVAGRCRNPLWDGNGPVLCWVYRV